MDRYKWILLTAILLTGILFYASDLGRYLTLDALKENRETLVVLYEQHRLFAVVGFISLYVVVVALSLPGAAIFSLGAGLLFGPFMGTVYAVVAATTGATLAFLGTRYFLRDTIEKKFGHNLDALNRALEKNGMHYLLFLRLVPAFPFFLVNLSAALTGLPLKTFVIGTAVGIIPGGFVFVNTGASLATINSLGDIVTVRVLGSFALLGFFTLIPVMVSRLKELRTRSGMPGTPVSQEE